MSTDFKPTSHFNLRYLSMLTALLALFVLCAALTKPERVVFINESTEASSQTAALR